MALPVLFASACGEAQSSFPEPPEGLLASEPAIDSGRDLYERSCRICHGDRGHGDGIQARALDPKPADLRNLTGVRGQPSYWFFRIREGGKAEPLARPRSAMPSWKDHLTDEQIWQLVAYLRTFIEPPT